MARYTGPQYKKSRRLNFSTLENGKDLARRPYAPGMHGTNRRKKLSEYGVQLQEKQKVRTLYGLNEKQFHRVFDKASSMAGITGENLLFLLESRLDNLVYRMGLALTRRGARQLVNHGHVLLNGKRADIPSIICKLGDEISIHEKSCKLQIVEDGAKNPQFKFVDSDLKTKKGKYTRYPERSELPVEINESYVVEWYNRLT